MFTKHLPLLLLFLSLFLNFMASTFGQVCPYPCYPPPTGPVNNPPVAITPPYPPQGSNYNNYPPPTSGGGGGGGGGGYNNFPNYPPPNNGYVNGLVPPPPDPILPWWPYHYRNRPDQFSSSNSIQESRNMIFIMITIIVPMFSLYFPLLFH
ncbi:hypothetical protein MTR67_016256 [Solanum verrucosum]|uniref:Uncharacterized protein n=2 Tax=Solanum verrucosum TaxID=315347 RepID=A0AAF0QLK9_SOLVR|nr:hypothetical protein MTR67_016256 [Solanum verrucosum]